MTATGCRTSLTEKGIGTGLHYPLPLHLQKAYAHIGFKKGDFPSPSAPPRACCRCPCSRS